MPRISRSWPPMRTKASPPSPAGAPRCLATMPACCARATWPLPWKMAKRWWSSWRIRASRFALTADTVAQKREETMSKRNWLLAGLVLLVLLGGGAVYYYWSNAGNDDLTATDTASSLPPDTVGANEHVMGNPRAPVTMIEYFAQACSVCAAFDQQVFPQLKAKYIDTGKVRYVMRLFPLFPV